jgi:hypothetical protein
MGMLRHLTDGPLGSTSSECPKDCVSEEEGKHPSPHSHEPQVGWIPRFENQFRKRIVLNELVAPVVAPLKPRLHVFGLEDADRTDQRQKDTRNRSQSRRNYRVYHYPIRFAP